MYPTNRKVVCADPILQSSSIYPLALVPGFYHWGVALPAYNTYNLLVEVWTHGCNPMHAQCLGVLFAWAIAGVTIANIGMWRRCAAAAQAEREEQDTLQRKIADATNASVSGSALSTSHDREKGSPDSAAFRRGSSRLGSLAGGTRSSPAVRTDLADMPYPEDLKKEVSKMGIRMPFADAVEGLGRSRLARRNTAS